MEYDGAVEIYSFLLRTEMVKRPADLRVSGAQYLDSRGTPMD
jgi:hypothetical protein